MKIPMKLTKTGDLSETKTIRISSRLHTRLSMMCKRGESIIDVMRHMDKDLEDAENADPEFVERARSYRGGCRK